VGGCSGRGEVGGGVKVPANTHSFVLAKVYSFVLVDELFKCVAAVFESGRVRQRTKAGIR
jgi:hypothetical protein